MCGIVGIIQRDSFSRGNLENMVDSIAYRGPDDRGIYLDVDKNNDFFIGLGQRRLSIIDLSSAGHQPMGSKDKSVWISFNGEIYNFLELKKDLIDKGYSFNSNTDTEVIIYGYTHYGVDFFNKLNGMFAFGIYDYKKSKLILGRDRFGQKPLYYWQYEKGITFASELKPIMLHPDFQKKIDFKGLNHYLTYEYLPSPYTILKDVKKLKAGYYLEVSFEKNGKMISKTKKYWDIDFFKYDFSKAGENEIIEQLSDLYQKSIKRRLMSDVPLGVFLSGGVDSSSILAMLNNFTDMSKINTFAIGFKEKSFNESNYARQVADYFGTNHQELILDQKKMLEIIPEVLGNLSEPLADASLIPTYLLSKFTSKHVSVALGGDGGDELFAGYDPFLAHQFADYYQKIPKFLHTNIIKPLTDRLPVSTKNMSFDFKVKHFLKGVYNTSAVRNQIWLSSFSDENDLFMKKNQRNYSLYQDIIDAEKKHKFRDDIDKLVFMYQKFYMGEDILTKVDRASMFNSLEVRAPFLDVELVEFVNSLPSKYKYRKMTRKYILKKMLENKLPHDIIYRQKKGFGIPLAKWIKEDLKGEILDTFSQDKIKREGIFNHKFINNLLSSHLSGKKDNRKQIWTLYVFEKWFENNIK